ncbi:hypothetical protein [Streptomyces aureus]|uniref:hypothetical protein n=1 Tax=Streptomyces aureus TaxID=193461 RepID=UPI0006E1680D|nr:hypothetical protein [Streptomyces aureus]
MITVKAYDTACLRRHNAELKPGSRPVPSSGQQPRAALFFAAVFLAGDFFVAALFSGFAGISCPVSSPPPALLPYVEVD